MSIFWKNWFRIWVAGIGLFGLILAAYAVPSFRGPTDFIFTLLNGQGTLVYDPYLQFSVGVMGCVSLGWAITLLGAMETSYALNPTARVAVWKWLTLSALVWFVTDSFISIHTGFWRNAVSNTVILIFYGIGLLGSGVLHTHADNQSTNL